MGKRSKRTQGGDKNRGRIHNPHAVPDSPHYTPVLEVLPPDSKGWLVLKVAPRCAAEVPQVLKVKVTTQSGVEKVVSLVRQLATLRVHVNPDPLGFDEWIMNDQMFQVLSEPEHRGNKSSSSSSTGPTTASKEEEHLPKGHV